MYTCWKLNPDRFWIWKDLLSRLDSKFIFNTTVLNPNPCDKLTAFLGISAWSRCVALWPPVHPFSLKQTEQISKYYSAQVCFLTRVPASYKTHLDIYSRLPPNKKHANSPILPKIHPPIKRQPQFPSKLISQSLSGGELTRNIQTSVCCGNTEQWPDISRVCVRTVGFYLRDAVASWEYQLSSERKSSSSYYWSLSVLSVWFYLLLSASSFSPHLSRYLISLYRLWSPTHLLSFCPLRSASPHPPAFSVRLYLSFSEDALYGFEEYNPLPHPPPLRKPWADTPGSVRPKRSPTVR